MSPEFSEFLPNGASIPLKLILNLTVNGDWAAAPPSCGAWRNGQRSILTSYFLTPLVDQAMTSPVQMQMDRFYISCSKMNCISMAPISTLPSKSNLFLIYLGRKQNSRDALKKYHQSKAGLNGSVDKVSRLTESINAATSLKEFESLVRQHENLVADILGLPTVQSKEFPDYWGTVKSLGAWGGDFVLATTDRPEEETRAYFQSKGMDVIFRYDELILS